MNQAEGLGAIATPGNHGAPAMGAARYATRVIAVTGGKGGVGKSCIAVNLALALAGNGHDTVLLDADLGLANVDVLLGLTPQANLANLMAGECTLADLALEGPHHLKVIPATSGRRSMVDLTRTEYAAIIRAFDDYPTPPEFLVVDTAAGITDSVLLFSAAADEIVVVVCDEPASLTDAYALIKVLANESSIRHFRVVTNMVRNAHHGRRLFDKLERVTNRFLDIDLQFCGVIPRDGYLTRAVRRQSGVVDAWPGSPSALAFKKLAQAADTWKESSQALGRIGFFAQQRVEAGVQAA